MVRGTHGNVELQGGAPASVQFYKIASGHVRKYHRLRKMPIPSPAFARSTSILDSPFRLVELALGVTAEEVAAKTTAHYI